MRKILGAVVLVAALLAPAQIALAGEQIPYLPFVERMMETEMKMDQVMMKMMKAKKMGMMSKKMKTKLMKMLDDLDTLLNRVDSEL